MLMTDYRYRAKVLRWIDGDTVSLQLILQDLGFGILQVYQPRKPHYRLKGVNTPEMHPKHANFSDDAAREKEKERARTAKSFSEKYAPPGATVMVWTHLDEQGKYGRPLVQLFTEEDHAAAAPQSLNERLVQAGLAVKTDY